MSMLAHPDHELRNSLHEFERIENQECLAAYGRRLVADRSDVILVLDPETVTSDELRTYSNVGDPFVTRSLPYDWICSEWGPIDCDPSSINPENWTFTKSYRKGERVEFCLSKPASQRCKLILNTYILGIVIVCNTVMLVGQSLAWLCLKERPLLTLGGLFNQVAISDDH